MTDLGNGLFAASVPEDATEIRLKKDKHNRHYLDYLTNKDNEVVLGIGVWSKIKILGTVTKDNISFDVDKLPYPLNSKGRLTSTIFDKGLFFENPLSKPKHYDEWKSELDKGYEHEYDSGVMKQWLQAQNILIEKLVIIKKV